MSDDFLKSTPMMQQWHQVKKLHPDCILFFRLGDFYEMFFGDAEVASQILHITLTSRNKNNEEKIPMCGIPFHSAERYIEKLLEAGKKIAICEQMGDPKLAKGLVERKVVQVLTPGLALEKGNATRENVLVSMVPLKDPRGVQFDFSYLELSTGKFKSSRFPSETDLKNELWRVAPRELLWPLKDKDHAVLRWIQCLFPKMLINFMGQEAYALSTPERFSHLRLGDSSQLSVRAIGYYLQKSHIENLNHVQGIETYEVHKTMQLDAATIVHLELLETSYDRNNEGSLLSLLDETQTAMGKRLLKQWLLYPLLDLRAIEARQESIQELVSSPSKRDALSKMFKGILDLERILARLTLRSANARDLIALRSLLQRLPSLEGLLSTFGSQLLSVPLPPFVDLALLLEEALVDEPPLTLKEGGMIRSGFHESLDELIMLSSNAKTAIAKMEQEEKEKTGISSLKIKYNQVFGYYIEVTHTNLKLVPSHYIRKQTMVNAERFITQELKNWEDKVLHAEERRKKLEYEIFEDIRQKVLARISPLLEVAQTLAEIDVLCALATVALHQNYVRPMVNDGFVIDIKAGRHPVIEKAALNRFVPNDTFLNHENLIWMITGPNMAGKSTYMRQVALMVLLAQIGSFVPAQAATIGKVDRIFTRIGAQDNLSQGESTFMVEMKETAAILNQATSHSLIVLDEMGRGTSTFDGVSIAWAVLLDIHDRIQAKTLFATHYHELTLFSAEKDKIKNYYVAVEEIGGELVFVRKILSGSIRRSYGVEVAKLAGLPASVIETAKQILMRLENQKLIRKVHGKIAIDEPLEGKSPQLGLF